MTPLILMVMMRWRCEMWILMVYLLDTSGYAGGVSFSMQEFSSAKTCLEAKKMADEMINKSLDAKKTVCVPK